ncbi:nucleoside-diphosphate sugar epimerase [Clostridia bacterium]|nr:nucleoside-diphosphate sugar epimerase [Clostridia bacterium]
MYIPHKTRLMNIPARRIILATIDCLIYGMSFAFSVVIWSGVFQWPNDTAQFFYSITVISLLHLVVYSLGGLYSVLWSLASFGEAMQMVTLDCVSLVLAMVADQIFGWPFTKIQLLFTSALSTVLILSSRFIWRLLLGGRLKFRKYSSEKPLMIVGAGEAAVYLIEKYLSESKSSPGSMLLVDEDRNKQNLRVHGMPVLGGNSDIPELVIKYGVKEILIAIPSLKGKKYSELANLCIATKCRVRTLSSIDESMRDGSLRVRDIKIEDLLSRDEVVLDTAAIADYLKGTVVLVTGGGGSIGSEICRQVMKFNPKLLLIYDIYENTAYELQMELQQVYGRSVPVEVLIGNICDKDHLEQVISKYKPSVVFHAAAHKHVPLMETSPAEAVRNNILGTKNVLDVAAAHGVKRFVLLSTDKAVNPTSIMGATKRVCEMLIQSYAKTTDMRCMAVRFGNVLGSHGSVIPLFKSQITAGGPVTVTHPDIVRYFMTISEAARLVLQAGGMADSGAIYVLKMGEPVKIRELAEKMIRSAGEDIEIKYTGLRPGEKKFEELLTDNEKGRLIPTKHESISIAANGHSGVTINVVGGMNDKEALSWLRSLVEINYEEHVA